MLKHSIVLKFNNVEMLKTPWKMLKSLIRDVRNRTEKLRLLYSPVATTGRRPSAHCRAKKVAQRPDVKSVHLYRIDKTEIFA